MILPTHRVVKHLDADAIASFDARAREIFEVEEFDDRDRMRAELTHRGRGIHRRRVARIAEDVAAATSRSSRARSRRAETPSVVRELDVSILHAMVFDRIFGVKPEAIKAGGNLEYTIDAAGALDAVSTGAPTARS